MPDFFRGAAGLTAGRREREESIFTPCGYCYTVASDVVSGRQCVMSEMVSSRTVFHTKQNFGHSFVQDTFYKWTKADIVFLSEHHSYILIKQVHRTPTHVD